MRYLHLIARARLPYKMLRWWYRLTIGKNFVGTYHRYPFIKSEWLIEEVDSVPSTV